MIIRTYLIGRPAGLDPGRRAIGALTVSCLCLLVAAPLGFGANLANSQRNLLETLFRGGDGGTPAAEAIAKPRLNILLVGSDAGPDRTGARTDTMMVASIDTRTGRTTLFGAAAQHRLRPVPGRVADAQRVPRRASTTGPIRSRATTCSTRSTPTGTSTRTWPPRARPPIPG